MVAAGPVTGFSLPASFSKASDGQEDASKEASRIKAEILSARSEKQCTTCEGDKDKLDQKIRELEAKLRQAESKTNGAAPPETGGPAGQDGSNSLSKPGLESTSSARAADPADRRHEGLGRVVDIIA